MNKIKEMRTKRGMSQQDLADKLGVGRSTVTLWELGVNKPRADMLIELAKVFNCQVDDFLCPVK